MSILMGDTGKPKDGTLKTINITMATPREDLLGTPLTLPTTEPATAQISYTIQQSDLPTILPNPISFKYLASVINAGKMTTSGAISYRCLKNGASVASGTTASVSANFYFTETHWRWYDITVGDVLEVKLWSSVADTVFDYSALSIYPTQVFPVPANTLMKDVVFTTVSGSPSLTLGNPNITNTSGINVHPTTSSNTSYSITITSSGMSFPVLGLNSLNGLFRMTQGDSYSLTTYHQQNATLRPSYQKLFIPYTINYRELLR